MARAQQLGWGASVAFTNLTTNSLTWAINEVLSNQKYEKNVKKIANRLLDQPETPMERAMFWIEYVLRHDGAEFMQTSAQYLNAFEYHNLDVYLTFFSITIALLFICFKSLKCIMMTCSNNESSSSKIKVN